MELDQFIRSVHDRKRHEDGNANRPTAATGSTPSPRNNALPLTPVKLPTDTVGPSGSSSENLDQFKQRLHAKLIERVDPNTLRDPRRATGAELRYMVEQIIDAEGHPMSLHQKNGLIEEVLDDALGFGPLERLLRDPSISDILINGARCIYVERNGVLEEANDVSFRDNNHLLEIVRRIVSRVGRIVNESSPMVDARLPDGSRFNAIVPPLALDGPLVSIRRFGKRPLRIVDLLALKALSPEMSRYLEAAVKARLNILVSGGTGSGKTTLLNALSSFIPADERIVTIEDAAELKLQQRHVGALKLGRPTSKARGRSRSGTWFVTPCVCGRTG